MSNRFGILGINFNVGTLNGQKTGYWITVYVILIRIFFQIN